MRASEVRRQLKQQEHVIAARWRRRAHQMTERALEEYRAEVREQVLEAADRLRQEAARNPRHPYLAQELLTRLVHTVVTIAPPAPRIEGEHERVDAAIG